MNTYIYILYRKHVSSSLSFLRMLTKLCAHIISLLFETIYAPLKIPSSSSSSIALNPFHGIVNRDVSFVLAPNIFPMVIYLLTVFPDISSRAQPK